jgi:hypothetical protein
VLGAVVLHPESGEDVAYPVPQPGHSVTIEDVVRVGVEQPHGYDGKRIATVQLNAVRVRLLSQPWAMFHLAHSTARLRGGVGDQIYGGVARPGLGHDASGLLPSARSSHQEVPCLGSRNFRSGGSVYGRDLSDSVSARKVAAYQRSGLTASGRARVAVFSKIRKVTIDGRLEIFGVHGRAISKQSADGYVLSGRGTSVRDVKLDGVPVQLHGRDPVRVDGIAVLQPRIVSKVRGSIEVTALRVRLLDGSGEVFDLGFARATLRPSGV